jgi:hypothetical protein
MGTLICHRRPNPFAVPTLAPGVRLSPLFSLLISAVGCLSLVAPGFGPTGWATVALTTVAANADSKY